MATRHQHTLESEINQENRIETSSHTNYRYLSASQKDQRLSKLHSDKRSIERKNAKLMAKLEEVSKVNGVELDQNTSDDMLSIMKENSHEVEKKYSTDSFPSIFWQQQLKAAQINPKSMRWHPLMLKWCIHLCHYSSSGYESLRKSGCLHLPSQRTLRDYTHFVTAAPGFSTEIDKYLIEAARIASCKPWERCHLILMDEMYIKEDLVYNKHTGNNLLLLLY